MFRFIFAYLCISILFLSGNAQTIFSPSFRFSVLAIEDGLSHGNVNDILQDHIGFMWFATDNGLNKYDGKKFVVYKSNGNEKGSLSDDFINTIFEDSKHNLWVGTNTGGVNLYNRAKDTFRNFKFEQANPIAKGSNTIRCFYEDKNGRIWIGTNFSGLYYYAPETDRLVKVSLQVISEKDLYRYYVSDIIEDEAGNLAIGIFGNGLLLLNPETKMTKHFVHNPTDPGSVSHNKVYALIYDKKGRFWVGTVGGGLCLFDPESASFEQVLLANEQYPYSGLSEVLDIAIESNGKLWIGTDGAGVVIYDPETKKATSYSSAYSNYLHGLNGDVIRSVYRDNLGRMWTGAYNSGVSFWDPYKFKFEHYKNIPFNTKSLSNNNVKIIADGGNNKVWISTDGGGLNLFDIKSRTFEKLRHEKGKKNTLPNNKTIALVSEPGKGLWIGNWSGGISYYDLKNEKFKFFRHDPQKANSLSHDNVMELLKDRDGNLWAGTMGGGLNLFNESTESFEHFKNNPQEPTTICSDFIWAITESQNGELWIGTFDGLSRMDKKTRAFKSYLSDPQDSTSLKKGFIFSIVEDSKNRLWVGSYGGGLHLYNRENDNFFQMDQLESFPFEIIYQIQEDDNGDLWMSTEKGLVRVQIEDCSTCEPIPFSFKTKLYTEADGLQGRQFSRGSSFKNEDGIIFFGGINGFNFFHPDQIKENKHISSVVITGFQLFYQSVATSENSLIQSNINHLKSIELDHTQNVFSIEFSALDFTNPDNNNYAFKLENFDQSWHQVKGQNKAFYTNLDPGIYEFKVKGSNNDNVWNEEPVSLKLNITTPWWRSKLFYGFLAIFPILSGAVFYFLRVRFLRDRSRRLDEMVIQRTRELEQKSVEIESKNQLLFSQKNEISVQNEKLIAQQTELERSNNELKKTLEKLKKAQANLVESEKLVSLGMISAGIAHEINNPINYINSGIVGLKKAIGKITILLAEYDKITPENCEEKLVVIQNLKNSVKYKEMISTTLKVANNIISGAQRTSEIVKSLKGYSRQDAGDLKDIDIHEELEATLLLLQHQLKGKIEIQKEFQKIPRVKGFPGRINQVFMNLISNSIQSISNKGKVSIKTEANSKYVMVSISDTGKGMSPDTMKKIFEPFYTTKEVGQGTGLGLSITLNIIKQHHGKIEVESEPGMGTTFKIFLPLNQLPPATEFQN
ncbi:ligand-binding sensor domain-containing protein [Flexithrix dorotheae]|uniref:ligand-binding sensor domain-containing protein n=1 Tax=Flexithrix dorotheae TaxID=70993 RepID=UPI000A068325|nr:two-component regulator propeller domain-containing protein [Flexithrix dorotheae]